MQSEYTPEFVARFWARVDKTSSPHGCWLWTGATVHNGYGTWHGPYGQERSHRVSWKLANGALPFGLFVCHRCDVRPCVRPDHLFLGTALENSRDGISRGRRVGGARNPARGEENGIAILTEHQVRAIRAAYGDGSRMNQRDLAAQYGVCQRTVAKVIRRLSWKHVP